jgi:hypothetical protein
VIPHDDTTTRRRRAVVPPSEDVVVAQLRSLAPSLDGEPDPAFRSATRTRLVAMAAVRTPAPPPASRARALLSLRDSAPARWRSRLTAGLAGAAVAVTALATLVAVSAGAGPGDALYGLKRGTEQTQLALAGDSTRGRTLLDFASTRLAELRTLVDNGATAAPAAGAGVAPDRETVLAAGASPELVLETMRTMNDQTTEGAASLDHRAVAIGSAAPLELLADWAHGQSAGLEGLRAELPAEAGAALTDSLGLLSAISTRVSALRTALDCSSGPSTRGTDELGPLPVPCVVPPSPSPSTGVPGSETGTPPAAGVPGTSTPPGGTGTTAGSGTGAAPSGSTGGTRLPAPLPSGPAPTPPTGGSLPSIPVPSPPLPTGKLPLPSVTLPGTSIGTPGATDSSPLVDLCIGPVSLGNC